MAKREIKFHGLLMMALVLSVVLLSSVVQARPPCDFQVHGQDHAMPITASQHLVDVVGLLAIKSTGPSPPGEGN
ncbi:hypothetical protein L484_008421 [Morus notabilis]|uniref:Uncharacterized protein n=1 Tax=Morus notabilis TaxID=981085 RepID=W9S8X7_9ROSA|nr:hypothetical protein L484_008421 [Morus notabilis]